jgi:hypothetical protein
MVRRLGFERSVSIVPAASPILGSGLPGEAVLDRLAELGPLEDDPDAHAAAYTPTTSSTVSALKALTDRTVDCAFTITILLRGQETTTLL